MVAPLLFLAAGGCALNPVSGRPEVVLVSQEQEEQLGREEARKVAQTIGLVDDAAFTRYFDAVGQRLAAQSPRHGITYTFAVVDSPEPNAFALPGGYVYVTRGLLTLLNSEDELACVVGHEIGHVAPRHSVQKITRAAPLGLITGIASGVTGLVSPLLGQVVGGIGGLANSLVLAPYSRDQEREADRLGQAMAARAGWDPDAMSRMLRTLEREQELHGETGGCPPFDVRWGGAQLSAADAGGACQHCREPTALDRSQPGGAAGPTGRTRQGGVDASHGRGRQRVAAERSADAGRARQGGGLRAGRDRRSARR